MEGKKFNKLTVLKRSGRKLPSGTPLWDCACECGNITQTTTAKLNNGVAKSCGCSKHLYRDYSPQFKSHEGFIKDAMLLHGSRYIYDKAVYTRSNEKICITCHIHGDFYQTPNAHLNGSGCPGCVVSGFKQTLTGSLYVFVYEEIVKVGITNRPIRKRLRQQRYDSGKRFKLFMAFEGLNGKTCLDLERFVLNRLDKEAIRLDEKFPGSSECFVNIHPEQVLKIIEEGLQS